jgi:hypothetical protein
MLKPDIGSLVGEWTYRSFVSNPDVSVDFNDLEFGRGTIAILDRPFGTVGGTIGGPGWSLSLSGSLNYGDPYSLRFQGTGVVGGEEWIYDYAGYVVKPWPNGVDQVPAMVGSVIRTIPHSGTSQGTVAPAGVVCCWTAVWSPPTAP